jgi:(p)ppGpp synthase/HD superfamily hydrolase
VNRYEALRHATIAHAPQLDKCGRPYILHPIAVANALELGYQWWPEQEGSG